jgi:lipid-A-disaccharide synthase-like uncharacterized protein
MATLISQETLWLIIGLAGQACFSARFAWQWFHSERAGRSVIPTGFWYLSIGGGMTLLAYALYRLDPVFIIGQSFGLIVYLRNLQFLRRGRPEA